MKKWNFVIRPLKGEIHSFPLMYNTWGVHIVKMVQTNDFLKKSGRKKLIWVAMILDQLTSERDRNWGFRKCGSFWAWALFIGCQSRIMSAKVKACQKINTATILSFRTRHGISVGPTWLGPRWFRARPEDSKLWPCLFFLTPHFAVKKNWKMTQLWQPITPLLKLPHPKTTTFS